MFTFVAVLALVAIVALLVRNTYTHRPLAISADVALLQTDVDLDPLIFHRLRAIPGAAVVDASHGRFALASTRVPGWAVVAMIFTFPLGLVFLLIRNERRLNLAIVPTTDGGTALRFTGVVEAHVWRRVSRALAPLVRDVPLETPRLSARP